MTKDELIAALKDLPGDAKVLVGVAPVTNDIAQVIHDVRAWYDGDTNLLASIASADIYDADGADSPPFASLLLDVQYQ